MGERTTTDKAHIPVVCTRTPCSTHPAASRSLGFREALARLLRLPNFVASRLALEKSTPPRYPAYFGRDGGGPAQLANPHKGKSKACTHRKPDLRTFPQSPSSDRPSGAQGCPYRGIDRASRCLQRSTTVEAKDIGLLSRPSGRPCSVDSRL